MRRTTGWVVGGAVLLAAAGPAAAQTTGGAFTTPIPRSNMTLGSGGGSPARGALNTTAPIRTGGGYTYGGQITAVGVSAGGTIVNPGVIVGSGIPAGTGGGSGLLGGGRPAPSLGQELLLLTEARLLVEQIEATGNVVLNRRESLLLTLLVYESLRRQVVQTGVGSAGAAQTGVTGLNGGPPAAGFPIR